MTKLTKLMLTTGIALSALGAQAQNLVQNGSFEMLTNTSVSGGYAVINAGSTNITGWTVGGNSVDVINGAFGAISGNSIDMLGSPGPGSLSQTVNTVIGQTYDISFALSYNSVPQNGTVLFSLNNDPASSFSAASNTAPFTTIAFQYMATQALTTLTFASTGGAGGSGVVLDNVAMVSAVPEPETYAMMLAGLGLMGAVARRRKAKQTA